MGDSMYSSEYMLVAERNKLAECTFCFLDDRGNEIGRLTWGEGELRFTGSADASAKLFFDYLLAYTIIPAKE